MLSRAESGQVLRAQDVATALGAKLEGDGAVALKRLVHPKAAQGGADLALAVSEEASTALAQTKAQAVIVTPDSVVAAGRFTTVLRVAPSRNALAVLTALFDKSMKAAPGIHATAIIAKDAVVDDTAAVGAYVVIGSRTRIGPHAVIADQVSIGAGVTLGAYARIYPGARIGDDVTIGDRSLIYHNAVIGSDGYSFAPEMMGDARYGADVKLSKIHSLGNVLIESDVEIGANTTIDRSTLETTVIGAGTKIDNQVHVGHNVTIGKGTLICGACAISGSVKIGDRVRIGGGVGIADHVTIGTEAVIVAGSGVATNVAEGTMVSGYPAIRHDRSLEIVKYTMRQKSLYRAFDELVSRVTALEQPGQTERKG